MNEQKKLRVLGRGLGNIASQVILMSKKYFPEMVEFSTIIIRYDDVTIRNLKHLTKYLPETLLLLTGDNSNELDEIVNIHKNTKFISSVTLDVNSYDVALDFTEDVNPLIKFINGQLPIVTHCKLADIGPNQLCVPPMWGAKPVEKSMVFRVYDCLLSGTVPFISKILPLVDTIYSINFITHLGESGFDGARDHTSYFSKPFMKKKLKDFSDILKKDCVINVVSKPGRGPFYTASFACKLNNSMVESIYGNMQNFDKWVFEPVLHGVNRIETSRADNDEEYLMYKVYDYADEIDAYLSDKFSGKEVASPIVFFKRSFTRDGDNCGFCVGFDTSFLPGLSVLDLLCMFSRYGILPITPLCIDECMRYIDNQLFKKEQQSPHFDPKTFSDKDGTFGDISLLSQQHFISS